MPQYSERGEFFSLKSSDGEITYLQYPLQAIEVQGMAMPPTEHRTSRSPFQHGETILGFNLRPRPIQVAVHMRGCDRLDMYHKRRDFIRRINPLVGDLRFRVSFRDGRIFELHRVMYDAGFDVGTNNQPEPAVQSFGARFIAYDPVWFEWPEQTESVTIVSDPELIFPIEFPIVFGGVGVSDTIDIVNGGTWVSYPTILLTGPMGSPQILNLTTEEELSLDYYISASEVVTISTAFGEKTIESSEEGNLLGYLTPSSDLATFHLDPDPLAEDGVNTIQVATTASTAHSAFEVRWFDRYLGL